MKKAGLAAVILLLAFSFTACDGILDEFIINFTLDQYADSLVGEDTAGLVLVTDKNVMYWENEFKNIEYKTYQILDRKIEIYDENEAMVQARVVADVVEDGVADEWDFETVLYLQKMDYFNWIILID